MTPPVYSARVEALLASGALAEFTPDDLADLTLAAADQAGVSVRDNETIANIVRPAADVSTEKIALRAVSSKLTVKANCGCSCCVEQYNRDRHDRAIGGPWCTCDSHVESERCDCIHCQHALAGNGGVK